MAGEKEVRRTDEHEDREGQTLITRDHDVIKRWAEERGRSRRPFPGQSTRAVLACFAWTSPGTGAKASSTSRGTNGSPASMRATCASSTRSTRPTALRATSSGSTIQSAKTADWLPSGGGDRVKPRRTAGPEACARRAGPSRRRSPWCSSAGAWTKKSRGQPRTRVLPRSRTMATSDAATEATSTAAAARPSA
jgi:hypothetical protein